MQLCMDGVDMQQVFRPCERNRKFRLVQCPRDGLSPASVQMIDKANSHLASIFFLRQMPNNELIQWMGVNF